MTLKTRNKMTFQTIFMTSHFFQHNSLSTTTDFYDFLISSNTITVNNNSPIQDYVHPDDQTQPTFIIKTTKLFIQRWMKKFSQSVFLSDFNFIVVSYLIVPVAKFNIICERRTSTKLSKPSMVTPHYLFIIILVNTLGAELNEEKEKKKKIGQVLNVGNMFKNKENVSQKTDIWGFGNHGNNFKEKVMTKTIFFVGCKKSAIHWLRVLTTLAFRGPYISEFYFGLTS